MKIYISGPMTGIKNFNRPAFNAADVFLTDQGYDVINPVIIGEKLIRVARWYEDSDPSWFDYMAADLHALPRCDGIYMLRR